MVVVGGDIYTIVSNMKVYAISMFIFCNNFGIHVSSNTAPICKPTISEGTHSKQDVGGITFIECHMSTCETVYAVRYEKTNLRTPTQWTPVYEKANKTYDHIIVTGNTNYTLQNRTLYKDFPTHHMLAINPLKLEDQGKWRCVVYDHTNHSVESPAINIVIYEIGKILSPKKEVTIGVNPNSTFTLNCSVFGNTITWQRDGKDVTMGRFIHKHNCNNDSGICTSNITSKPVEVSWTCENVREYAGVYTCAATQQLPCTSNHTSPNMTVQVFHKPFVTKASRNITACRECKVTLRCDICSGANSTSIWTYNEEILQEGNKVDTNDGSMIHTIHHFGKYTRTVENKHGEAQCELNISSCGLSCNSHVVALVCMAVVCILFVITGVCFGVYWWRRKAESTHEPEGIESNELDELNSDMHNADDTQHVQG